MRRVAIRAIVANRRMLKQEGPALFGMARITDLIDAVCFEQRRRRAAVGIVAIGTGHLAFEKRHVGTAAKFGALFGMALKAGFVRRLARR